MEGIKQVRGAIIIDGTWPKKIILGHLGQLWVEIFISGKPVAACVENRGRNPIKEIPKILKILNSYRRKQQIIQRAIYPRLPSFFINYGCIQSGVWAGSVPAFCKILIQVGFGPPFTPFRIFKDIKKCILKKVKYAKITKKELSRPFFIPKKISLLAEKLKKIIKIKNDKQPIYKYVSGHSDMEYLKTKNVIMYGPGAGWGAHGTNERYKLTDMPLVIENLLSLLTSLNYTKNN